MNISESLRKIRQEKNISQAELAKKAGLSEISIRKYESGERIPKFENILRISEALDIPVLDIVDWSIYGDKYVSESFRNAKAMIERDRKNDLIKIYQILNDNGKAEAPGLLKYFSQLNNTGRYEAVKRVKELSKIEGYRKGDPEPPQF
ncbi:MAG: helix-turn-helix domain-containing protein [Hungatella sp.]